MFLCALWDGWGTSVCVCVCVCVCVWLREREGERESIKWIKELMLVFVYCSFFPLCKHSILVCVNFFYFVGNSKMFTYVCLAIAQEKTEAELRDRIGKFDKASLKHAETDEKTVLPNSEGEWQWKGFVVFVFVFLYRFCNIYRLSLMSGLSQCNGFDDLIYTHTCLYV